ncbi:MAG: phosphatidylserine decarboxylase [Kordiimonadaceae bacterium]|nr:phosphatidylserine decarboxylase [Kordiimonadaceae bacterium]
MMKASDAVMTPIHKEGHRFVAAFFIVSIILFFLYEPLGWVGLIISAWCLYFFRDPDRFIPTEDGVLTSPADGIVCSISEVAGPEELGMSGETRTRITIFLSVFNVHVNRVPAGGEITDAAYVPGKFLNAAAETASEENERQLIRMKTEDGKDIAFAQVAGLIARRILCDLKVGDKVARGDRFGLIRFGSRTDIYLDTDQMATVQIGQTMIGGETIIARNK